MVNRTVETIEDWHQEKAGRELSSRETAEALSDRFAWKHGLISSLLVRALSVVLVPLERGTYRGRALAGEPHRSRPVANTPLTVFVIPEGRRERFFLAARLRVTGPVNVIQDPAADASTTVYGDQGRRWGSLSMESLVTIQRASGESITVVPVTRAFHQHHPEAPATTFFTWLYMYTPMHVIRRAGSLLRAVRTARLRNCRPIELSEWLEHNPQEGQRSQATALRNELVGRIESECRASVGPPIPQPWQVRKAVLRDPILVEFMREHAAREGTSRRKVSKEARAHIREIASKLRVGVIRYFGLILNVGFDRLLTGFEVDREGIRLLSEYDCRSRLVLVCCHRSYMDPLILTYGICRSGLTPPQQAAGINLNIWPLGWVLRRCGAFYLRRSFVDEPVYREAFNAYVRRLLADNFITAFYIEGTRSRDGKMRKPKTGYIKILDEALRLGTCGEITLIPVYLGYDRVPEEGAHVREMTGGHKVAETMDLFKRLYKSVTVTGTLGRAYVKFGEPMDFSAIVSEHGALAAADLICEGIDRVTVVTARSLASCALLSSGRQSISLDEYQRAADEILGVCRELGLPLASDADPEGVRAAVERLASEERVAVDQSEAGAGCFRVEGDRRRFLEYNKNILLAHLLGPSLAALAEQDEGRADEALLFLRSLFAEEFVFGPGFADEARAHGSGSQVLMSLMDSFLEGYLVACTALGSLSDEERISRKDMVERCFAEGEKMLEEGLIQRREALSRIIFENSLRRFVNMGLLSGFLPETGAGKEEAVLTRGELFDQIGGLEERIRVFSDRDRE